MEKSCGISFLLGFQFSQMFEFRVLFVGFCLLLHDRSNGVLAHHFCLLFGRGLRPPAEPNQQQTHQHESGNSIFIHFLIISSDFE